MNPKTDIICLEIVKGIPAAPGDTETAEQPLVVLNLLDPNGFSVQVGGWTPAFPGIKRGGTWAESNVNDGRQLISAAKDNVTETITLAIGNVDLQQRFQLLGKLNRLLDDARAFWMEQQQIEPVYLKFKAACANVYQYALIYSGSLAQDNDPFEESNAWVVTLVLEREAAWRMVVPPGGNPLEYHFFSQGKTRGKDYTADDLVLYANEDHWAYQLMNNACEFNGADKTDFLTQTWIDVDATAVPGDAPALLLTTFAVAQKQINQVYLARTTEPRERFNRVLSDNAYARNTLNAGDASADVTRVVDAAGLRSNDQVANRYIHQETVVAATTTFTDSLQWQLSSDTGDPCAPFSQNQLNGEWAVYLRCQSTSGSDGDLEVRLVLNDSTGLVDEIAFPAAQVPYQNAVATTVEFDLTYMGRMQFPLPGAVISDDTGRGYTTKDGWDVRVQVRNTAGADRVFEVLDLIFMPLSEGMCIMNPNAQAGWPFVAAGATSRPGTLCADNTGYISHGKTEDICVYFNDGTEAPNAIQLIGNALTVKPGVNNRFYVLFRNYASAIPQQYCSAIQTPVYGEFRVRMNIVPRCYGIATL